MTDDSLMKTRDLRGISDRDIRAQLGRILASPTFSNFPGLRPLLEFMVEETLAGRADRLNQHTIGVDGLGYPPDFEPSINPAVRLLSRLARRRLKTYYHKPGADDAIRIEIPAGSYTPAFHRGV
jgi:hypothetical protein